MLSPDQIKAREGKLTASRVRQALAYDANTGIFTWRIRPKNNALIGSRAGTVCNDRRTIMLDGQRHYEHVLAWLYMTGDWPTGLLDHENNIGSDNRWANIRPATRRQNRANAKTSKNNLVGLKGVSQLPSGRFQARIAGHYLGSFDTKREAHVAYLQAASDAFGEFARAS